MINVQVAGAVVLLIDINRRIITLKSDVKLGLFSPENNCKIMSENEKTVFYNTSNIIQMIYLY